MDAFLELFSLEGRANRAWYLKHIILDDFVILALMVTLVMLMQGPLGGLWTLPLAGAVAGGFWAAVAVTVKRLHDLDRPGWHWWLMMVPLYNIYLGLVLVFQKGTVGPNSHGHDPLSGIHSAGLIEGGAHRSIGG